VFSDALKGREPIPVKPVCALSLRISTLEETRFSIAYDIGGCDWGVEGAGEVLGPKYEGYAGVMGGMTSDPPVHSVLYGASYVVGDWGNNCVWIGGTEEFLNPEEASTLWFIIEVDAR
jgi:hypothetical protein